MSVTVYFDFSSLTEGLVQHDKAKRLIPVLKFISKVPYGVMLPFKDYHQKMPNKHESCILYIHVPCLDIIIFSAFPGIVLLLLHFVLWPPT